ncbi:UdgX family uracil-DNA binding protein [Knoellia sp. Soil729]|uniref:UdgX family uracil-DNA binding protein n=1 Tax=Knoellia sp. Soil729 TaxID=1736394 RepID=UPI0006F3B8D8|nr:UdgX family uracil-DNA binding protein [Knoellia sp. Soil729]KRE40827.1 uracil-DNA glycosylase [Knoellia sp. Soil729]
MTPLRPSDFPGATAFVPAEATWAQLTHASQECRGCDLYLEATQTVFGEGPVPARLALVGEQPGDREDVAGEPFVGPAGRLLDRALEKAGTAREEVYVTNVVKHFRFTRPRGKQRIHKSPARWQVAACEPWLVAELSRVQPHVVVVLGATAGQAVFGPAFRVGTSRGTVVPWPQDRLPLADAPVCIPTAHPSSVLRSRQRDEDLAALVSDLQVAVAALDA